MSTATAPRASARRQALALLPVAALAALFFPTLVAYIDTWQTPAYNHGSIAAAAALWLIWRERVHLRPGPAGWRSAVAAGLLSLIWLASMVMGVRSVGQAVLPLLFLAWTAAALGQRAALRVLPATALLLLAVPVWEVLVPPLRGMTVAISTTLLRLVQIPAVIEGNMVHLRLGSFLIEDGCAGLAYLLAGASIGTIHAHVLLRQWKSRALVIAVAAGLAIVGNWLRVTSIIIIGHATEMRSSLVEEHLTFGWAIFLLGLGLFFPLAARVQRRERSAGGGGPVGTDATARAADGSLPPSSLWTLPGVRRATLAVVAGPLVFYAVGALPSRAPSEPVLPVAAAGWEAGSTGLERPFGWTPAFAGAGRRSSRSWSGNGGRVLVDRLVYEEQAHGAELIGYGSRIAADSLVIVERLMGPVGAPRRLVNEAIVREEDGHLLVWYWYRVGGVETQSAARAKLLELWAFFTRRRTSELVAISTPCGMESCIEAYHTLSRFLGAT